MLNGARGHSPYHSRPCSMGLSQRAAQTSPALAVTTDAWCRVQATATWPHLYQVLPRPGHTILAGCAHAHTTSRLVRYTAQRRPWPPGQPRLIRNQSPSVSAGRSPLAGCLCLGHAPSTQARAQAAQATLQISQCAPVALLVFNHCLPQPSQLKRSSTQAPAAAKATLCAALQHCMHHHATHTCDQ